MPLKRKVENMKDEYWDELENTGRKKGIVTVALLLITILAALLFLLISCTKNDKNVANWDGEEDLLEQMLVNEEPITGADAQTSEGNLGIGNQGDSLHSGDGSTETEIKPCIRSDIAEIKEYQAGIDVSRYQGTIDWKSVADSGYQFAMIRVGYRKADTGEIKEDANARYNLQEATAQGIQVGAYFFSTAITKEEALEEARWVSELISQYPVTFPVAFNYEGYETAGNRQSVLTQDERNQIAITFMDAIYEAGYTPMFYASKWELEGNNKWDTDTLEKHYKIWLSYYSGESNISIQDTAAPDEDKRPDYEGECAMWQYTSEGSVPGIQGKVDLNVAYFGFDEPAEPKDSTPPEKAYPDVEASMHFTEVQETVTAKDATNLRDIPDKGENSTVLYTLKNGQTAIRTAVSSEGWSRLEYDGRICYAVSQYLTTDLSYTPPKSQESEEAETGIKTVFTSCSDKVSPKMSVNLRTLPSVTNPESKVVVELQYGEVVERTGYNSDYGWSRVVYEGQTLYCISSYVYVVE